MHLFQVLICFSLLLVSFVLKAADAKTPTDVLGDWKNAISCETLEDGLLADDFNVLSQQMEKIDTDAFLGEESLKGAKAKALASGRDAAQKKGSFDLVLAFDEAIKNTEESTSQTPEIQKIYDGYQAARQALRSKADEKRSLLLQQFYRSLERKKTEATKQGNMEAAKAINEYQGRVRAFLERVGNTQSGSAAPTKAPEKAPQQGPAPKYVVIDLSGGPSASAYPVKNMNMEPAGGFNKDEYKTSKLVLKLIPAGSFVMGANPSDESHRVVLTKDFYMGIFEVTQKQWALVMGTNPSHFRGDKLPVDSVSYNVVHGAAAQAAPSSFLGKLRTRTGLKNLDLPTEAEWEYACRAGSKTAYSYGDAANGSYMWCNMNSGKETHDVGTKLPNKWGLYDMHGNLWEQCSDWLADPAYGTNPKGPASSPEGRVARGGAWSTAQQHCKVSDCVRIPVKPGESSIKYGFRLSGALPH